MQGLLQLLPLFPSKSQAKLDVLLYSPISRSFIQKFLQKLVPRLYFEAKSKAGTVAVNNISCPLASIHF